MWACVEASESGRLRAVGPRPSRPGQAPGRPRSCPGWGGGCMGGPGSCLGPGRWGSAVRSGPVRSGPGLAWLMCGLVSAPMDAFESVMLGVFPRALMTHPGPFSVSVHCEVTHCRGEVMLSGA